MGDVIILPTGEAFDTDFFADMVFPSIVEDSLRTCKKLKARGALLLGNA
jgi:hypothetical protein